MFAQPQVGLEPVELSPPGVPSWGSGRLATAVPVQTSVWPSKCSLRVAGFALGLLFHFHPGFWNGSFSSDILSLNPWFI